MTLRYQTQGSVSFPYKSPVIEGLFTRYLILNTHNHPKWNHISFRISSWHYTGMGPFINGPRKSCRRVEVHAFGGSKLDLSSEVIIERDITSLTGASSDSG